MKPLGSPWALGFSLFVGYNIGMKKVAIFKNLTFMALAFITLSFYFLALQKNGNRLLKNSTKHMVVKAPLQADKSGH
jgi:hypothetical protein